MPEPTIDPQLDEFLGIRKPGAHLEEGVVADDFVLMLGVDLTNYPKFPRVDDAVTYPKGDLDVRQQLDVDSGVELPDYGGPYRPHLRFTDFSKEALATKFLPWSERYLQLCVDGWAAEVAKRYGAEAAADVEWTAWNDQIAPELERMKDEFLPAGTVYEDPNLKVHEEDRVGTRVVYTGCSHRARVPSTSRRGSWSPGSSGATNTCCSASRRGPRRSRFVTDSTRCSTSSGRCGETRSFPG